MDDKLIIFKKDAIYYITGTGPDNTGANGTFSDATFITSTVGCANPSSIVLMPNGIMFQSDKGIWLLDRQLGTTYRYRCCSRVIPRKDYSLRARYALLALTRFASPLVTRNSRDVRLLLRQVG